MDKKNLIPAITALLAFLLIPFHAFPGNKPGSTHNPLAQTVMHGLNKDFAFTENKGQLADEKGNLLSDISYYGSSGGVNVYCRNGKISFVFTKLDGERPTRFPKPVRSGDDSRPNGFPKPGRSV